MLKERKVGKWFRIEGRIAGERIRLKLRTRNGENARSTVADVERALAKGPGSALWAKLRNVLPENSFERLAAIAGYRERPPIAAPSWLTVCGESHSGS